MSWPILLHSTMLVLSLCDYAKIGIHQVCNQMLPSQLCKCLLQGIHCCPQACVVWTQSVCVEVVCGECNALIAELILQTALDNSAALCGVAMF